MSKQQQIGFLRDYPEKNHPVDKSIDPARTKQLVPLLSWDILHGMQREINVYFAYIDFLAPDRC